MANHAHSAPVTSAKVTDWDAAVSAYRKAADKRDAASPNDWKDAAQEAAWEKLVDRASAALSLVTKYPVTKLAQLAEKCALVKAEYPDTDILDGADCAAIIADVLRIASPDAPATAGENPTLVAAFDQYCAAARVMRNDPEAKMSGEADDKLFAVMDAADEVLNANPARTAAGAVMKLRRVFLGTVGEPWSDFAVFDDRPPAFAEGLRMADLYTRMFWGAVEDLQRIAIDQHAARLANGGAAWDAGLAKMEAAKALSDGFADDEDTDASNDAHERYGEAMSDLMVIPAPDNAALLWKAEYLFGVTSDKGQDGYSWRADILAAYVTDVRRLAAMEG
ncbi:hypothetical protein U1872_18160 [Sphingomonas sp. RB3P16]|uniref:hypothetical protein n=1 Tax=Parasphingomonas frigoris TaxID=3096163 RepID=UPI002FC7095A